jgi:predicted membrane protein
MHFAPIAIREERGQNISFAKLSNVLNFLITEETMWLKSEIAKRIDTKKVWSLSDNIWANLHEG